MALARINKPRLEALCNDVKRGENVDLIARELHICTSNIHVSFLFIYPGTIVLQKICLGMDSTKTDKLYSDWRVFANKLGLDSSEAMCIENQFKEKNGPTWYVLLTYSQNDDATLGRVINVLVQLERLEIISAIKNSVQELVNYIENDLKVEDAKSEILKITSKVELPFVLRKPKIPKNTDGTEYNRSKIVNTIQKRRRSVPVVMLTFADDGAEIAERVSRKFRSNGIKVLILCEHLKYVLEKGMDFVADCFKQVNVIIPILTKGYLATIYNHPMAKESESMFAVDQKYVKFIYKTLQHECSRKNFDTTRVSCILPDDMNEQDLPRENIFLRIWFREMKIEEFSNYLHKQKRTKKTD